MPSTAKFAVGTQGSNIASTFLNNLASGSTATAMAYNGSLGNTGDGFFYARVSLELGSYNPPNGGYVQLNVFHAGNGGTVEDIVITAGDIYTHTVKSGTSVKRIVFYIRCFPALMSLVFTNFTGATFPSSGNAVYVTPISEQVV
jgi:hypothetical protein